MTEYRGSLTEDDFVEVVRLRRRLIREGGTASDTTLWLGLGFVGLALWGYLHGPYRNPESLWWLPFAVLCFALWWRRRANPRKLWRKEAALRDEFRGQVTDQALEARLGGIDARVPWSFFSSHLASPRALVLFVGTHLQVMLSSSMFATEEGWQAARATIAGHVPFATGEYGASRRRVLVLLGWTVGLMVLFLAWHFAQLPKK